MAEDLTGSIQQKNETPRLWGSISIEDLPTGVQSPPRSESRDSADERKPLLTQRDPFAFPAVRQSVPSQQQNPRALAAHSRVKYYSKIAPAHETLDLVMPHHVVPPVNLLIIGGPKAGGQQSSLVTILSLWNTMMGTSILTMPWAIDKAGFGLGIAIMLLMAFIACYTCYMLLIAGQGGTMNGKEVEFPDVCRHFLGKYAYYLSVLFSILTLLGASLVYWVLMSGFLYNAVDFFHNPHATPAQPINHTTTTHSPLLGANSTSPWNEVWNPTYVPLFLVILIFPLTNFKSLTFFTKFNSLGIVSVAYILFFVVFNAAYGNNYSHSPVGGFNMNHITYVNSDFAALSGVLALSFFIHNGCLSIMRNQKNPQNNVRDLVIAYLLVCATYLFVGITYYVSYKGPKDQINNNFLQDFSKSDGNFVLSLIAQICLLLQMTTVYPLLQYIMRFQVLTSFFDSEWPSTLHVVGLNLFITALCVLMAIVYPNIGAILRFSGALCGFVYVFALPCMVHLTRLKQTGERRWYHFVIAGMLFVLGFANFMAQFFITE